MPIAELAEALVVDDQTILPAGEQLTGQQAHDHWLQHQKPMKFRCVHCRLPLISVNIDNPNWKRTPHFRAHDNEEHTLPCVYAGESQPHTRAPSTFEVADDKLDIPTELKLKARRHHRAVAGHTTVPTSGKAAKGRNGMRSIRRIWSKIYVMCTSRKPRIVRVLWSTPRH